MKYKGLRRMLELTKLILFPAKKKTIVNSGNVLEQDKCGSFFLIVHHVQKLRESGMHLHFVAINSGGYI